MGGFGSGFWRLRKRAVENCLGLRLVSVSRTVIALYCTNSGFVVWSITREWKDEKVKGIHRLLRSISIKYATVFDSQWRTVTQDFQLQASVPNFNGRRWWFRCQCGRKVGRLYLPPNERYFACRHCHALNYRSSQQEDKRAQAQGVVYGVEDGMITSAGYIIRQADLVAGKSTTGTIGKLRAGGATN